jgi:hypothetical protein
VASAKEEGAKPEEVTSAKEDGAKPEEVTSAKEDGAKPEEAKAEETSPSATGGGFFVGAKPKKQCTAGAEAKVGLQLVPSLSQEIQASGAVAKVIGTCNMCAKQVLSTQAIVNITSKKADGSEYHYLRHKDCQQMSNCMNNVLRNGDDAQKEFWQSNSKDEQMQWWHAHEGLAKEGLATALQSSYLESISQTQDKEFRIRGHPTDEVDLRAKYLSKPDQLESILANANSFVCPVRNVRLYEDPDYQTSRTNKEELTKKRTREADQSETLKKKKNPPSSSSGAKPVKDKADKVAKPIKIKPVAVAKPISELVKGRLEGLIMMADVALADSTVFVASLKRAEPPDNAIPQKLVDNMEEARIDVMGLKPDVQLILDEGAQPNKPNDIQKMHKVKIERLKQSTLDIQTVRNLMNRN